VKLDYRQQALYHSALKDVIGWIEAAGILPSEPVQTSGYRPSRPGTRSTHGTLPCRAMDLRCRDDKLGRYAQDTINRAWIYDPERPALRVALYHDTGQGAHLHIQVHDNTRPRE